MDVYAYSDLMTRLARGLKNPVANQGKHAFGREIRNLPEPDSRGGAKHAAYEDRLGRLPTPRSRSSSMLAPGWIRAVDHNARDPAAVPRVRRVAPGMQAQFRAGQGPVATIVLDLLMLPSPAMARLATGGRSIGRTSSALRVGFYPAVRHSALGQSSARFWGENRIDLPSMVWDRSRGRRRSR
jgi:hypothetical protein